LTQQPRTNLHDPAFDMRLAAVPGDGPTLPRHLTFTPLHNEEVCRDLAIVHEHPLHLIVVSSDLTFFDHVHPTPQPDGSLAIDYAFPKAGRYVLFADITPKGDRSQ